MKIDVSGGNNVPVLGEDRAARARRNDEEYRAYSEEEQRSHRCPRPARTVRDLRRSHLALHCACLAWAALASFACAGPTANMVVNLPSQPLAAVAVAPIVLHTDTIGGDLGIEAFKRTQDVLDLLWRTSAITVIGPTEFEIHNPHSDNVMMATNLFSRAHQLGLDPERLCLLSISVTSRKSSGSKVTSRGAKKTTGSAYRHKLAVSLTVRDMRGNYLLELDLTAEVDPFAENPEHDSRPELRETILLATGEFVDQLGSSFVEGERPPFTLTTSPAVVFDGVGSAGQPLREMIAAGDALEQDRLLWLHQQYFAPEITLRQAQQNLKTPSGACFGDDAPPPFVVGDCVATIGNAPVPNVHALGRTLTGDRAVDLGMVGTDGNTRVVAYP